MGFQNVQLKEYMRQNDYFADLCNYYLFDGREVVKPEDLEEKDVTELVLPQGWNGKLAAEKIRDVLRTCVVKSSHGVTYLIVGVENQADVHYAMVVRNMLYDAMNYASQVSRISSIHKEKRDLKDAEFLSGFAKEDKLHPVITITVYWNTGAWDGARSLHEMLDVNDIELLDYVSDYKLNLVVPEELKELERFRTELGTVLGFLHYADSKRGLQEFLQVYEGAEMSNEARSILNSCVKAGLKLIEKKGDEKVCKGMIELMTAEREEGREEGIRAGYQEADQMWQEKVSLLSTWAKKNDHMAELVDALGDPEALERLYLRVVDAER